MTRICDMSWRFPFALEDRNCSCFPFVQFVRTALKVSPNESKSTDIVNLLPSIVMSLVRDMIFKEGFLVVRWRDFCVWKVVSAETVAFCSALKLNVWEPNGIRPPKLRSSDM